MEEKRRKGKLKRGKGSKKGWERVGWRSKRIEKKRSERWGGNGRREQIKKDRESGKNKSKEKIMIKQERLLTATKRRGRK